MRAYLSIFDDIAQDIHDCEDMGAIEDIKQRTRSAIDLGLTARNLGHITFNQYEQLEALEEITMLKITLRAAEIAYERLYA